MSGRWVDLREAADLLGTSTEAVRKRAARGSLRSDRHNGRVVVWVDDRTEGRREAEVDGGPLVEMLADQVAYLRSQLDQEREANRENRRIIAALTQRIPELEPPRDQSQPQEQPGGPESVVEEQERAGGPGPVPQAHRRVQSPGPGGAGCSGALRQVPGAQRAWSWSSAGSATAVDNP